MANYNALLDIMKQAGANATKASNPVSVCFGKVTSAEPLKILVEQKITLGSAQLVLTRNVIDYDASVTVDWQTETALGTHSHTVKSEESTEDAELNTNEVDLSHNHKLDGRKTMTIHNALQTGDKVVLLRVQGGQKYVVMDRVV